MLQVVKLPILSPLHVEADVWHQGLLISCMHARFANGVLRMIVFMEYLLHMQRNNHRFLHGTATYVCIPVTAQFSQATPTMQFCDHQIVDTKEYM